MKSITIFFDPAFLRLLPARHRRLEIRYSFEGRPSIKHVLESFGVPHTEIGEIQIRENLAEMGHIIEDGEVYHIFPVRNAAHEDRTELPAIAPRFIIDTHLGKLATYLRLFGFDTLYDNQATDEDLARISRQDQRILLTRDRGLLKRKTIIAGFCLVQDDPEDQLRAVIERFGLSTQIHPFTRCLRCNGLFLPIEKKDVAGRVPEQSFKVYQEYWFCQNCNQVYWKGTHFEHMETFIRRVVPNK